MVSRPLIVANATLPDPTTFFSNHVTPVACAFQQCKAVAEPRGPLLHISTCGDFAHRNCLLHHFMQLQSSPAKCPGCDKPLLEYDSLALFNFAEAVGAPVKVDPFSEPIMEFDIAVNTEVELFALELVVTRTVIESILSDALRIEPNYVGAYIQIMNKLATLGMPWSTKYMDGVTVAQQLQWKVGVADAVLQRVESLKPASKGTREFAALKQARDDGCRDLEEEL